MSTFCPHGAIEHTYCPHCSGRPAPTIIKQARKISRNRIRLPKETLTGLAQALLDFEKLSLEDQEWVRKRIERLDII